jgi:SAM-dependent methyltransferase
MHFRTESMKKFEQSTDFYDRMFESGGYGGVYDLPYRHSSYLPLFRGVLREVRRIGARSILEVGCGTGGFAHLLMENANVRYAGFDFSPVAVEKARRRTGHRELFFVGDALDADSYKHAYDTIVCTEVLEHIEKDLEVVDKWLPGSNCICSVPNFDADSHVRFFADENQVAARYGENIAIDRIVRIRKPVLPDISWRSYARALRWYRYRPRQLLAALGIGTFASLGGWFVFSGTKR